MSYMLIIKNYFKEDIELNIKVLDYIGDRATDMKQGDEIYSLIIQGFKKGEKVCVDFEGLTTVLSTFLNNAIGTLYKDYDSEYLNKNLQINNLCEDDMFILRRVIKRAKEFYRNESLITGALDQAIRSE